MAQALFVHVDGTREYREVEDDHEWWLLPGPIENPGASPREWYGKVKRFKRERWWYDGDWSGPLESYWFWGKRTVYERGLPNEISLRFTGETSVSRSKRMGLLPTVGLQEWPVDKTIRVEVRYVEELSDGR